MENIMKRPVFEQSVSYQKLNHVIKLLSRTVQMQHILCSYSIGMK